LTLWGSKLRKQGALRWNQEKAQFFSSWGRVKYPVNCFIFSSSIFALFDKFWEVKEWESFQKDLNWRIELEELKKLKGETEFFCSNSFRGKEDVMMWKCALFVCRPIFLRRLLGWLYQGSSFDRSKIREMMRHWTYCFWVY